MPGNNKKSCAALQINSKTYPLYKGLNTIGRHPSAVVIVKDVNISHCHAIITIVDEENRYITDMKSSNHTFLNGTKLVPLELVKLKDNDEISLSPKLQAVYKQDYLNNTSSMEYSQYNSEVFKEATQVFEASTSVGPLKEKLINNKDTDDFNLETQQYPSNDAKLSQTQSVSSQYEDSFADVPTQKIDNANEIIPSNFIETNTQDDANSTKTCSERSELNCSNVISLQIQANTANEVTSSASDSLLKLTGSESESQEESNSRNTKKCYRKRKSKNLATEDNDSPQKLPRNDSMIIASQDSEIVVKPLNKTNKSRIIYSDTDTDSQEDQTQEEVKNVLCNGTTLVESTTEDSGVERRERRSVFNIVSSSEDEFFVEAKFDSKAVEKNCDEENSNSSCSTDFGEGSFQNDLQVSVDDDLVVPATQEAGSSIIGNIEEENSFHLSLSLIDEETTENLKTAEDQNLGNTCQSSEMDGELVNDLDTQIIDNLISINDVETQDSLPNLVIDLQTQTQGDEVVANDDEVRLGDPSFEKNLIHNVETQAIPRVVKNISIHDIETQQMEFSVSINHRERITIEDCNTDVKDASSDNGEEINKENNGNECFLAPTQKIIDDEDRETSSISVQETTTDLADVSTDDDDEIKNKEEEINKENKGNEYFLALTQKIIDDEDKDTSSTSVQETTTDLAEVSTDDDDEIKNKEEEINKESKGNEYFLAPTQKIIDDEDRETSFTSVQETTTDLAEVSTDDDDDDETKNKKDEINKENNGNEYFLAPTQKIIDDEDKNTSSTSIQLGLESVQETTTNIAEVSTDNDDETKNENNVNDEYFLAPTQKLCDDDDEDKDNSLISRQKSTTNIKKDSNDDNVEEIRNQNKGNDEYFLAPTQKLTVDEDRDLFLKSTQRIDNYGDVFLVPTQKLNTSDELKDNDDFEVNEQISEKEKQQSNSIQQNDISKTDLKSLTDESQKGDTQFEFAFDSEVPLGNNDADRPSNPMASVLETTTQDVLQFEAATNVEQLETLPNVESQKKTEEKSEECLLELKEDNTKTEESVLKATNSKLVEKVKKQLKKVSFTTDDCVSKSETTKRRGRSKHLETKRPSSKNDVNDDVLNNEIVLIEHCSESQTKIDETGENIGSNSKDIKCKSINSKPEDTVVESDLNKNSETDDKKSTNKVDKRGRPASKLKIEENHTSVKEKNDNQDKTPKVTIPEKIDHDVDPKCEDDSEKPEKRNESLCEVPRKRGRPKRVLQVKVKKVESDIVKSKLLSKESSKEEENVITTNVNQQPSNDDFETNKNPEIPNSKTSSLRRKPEKSNIKATKAKKMKNAEDDFKDVEKSTSTKRLTRSKVSKTESKLSTNKSNKLDSESEDEDLNAEQILAKFPISSKKIQKNTEAGPSRPKRKMILDEQSILELSNATNIETPEKKVLKRTKRSATSKDSVEKTPKTKAKSNISQLLSLEAEEKSENIKVVVPKTQDSDSSSKNSVVSVVPAKRGRKSKAVEALNVSVASTSFSGASGSTRQKVAFTMLDSAELRKIVTSLRGTISDSIEKSTVLVTERIQRTPKLLAAIALGIPISSPQWIHQSKESNAFLDPWEHLLKDLDAESRWGFCLVESYERSKKAKLFNTFSFQLLVKGNLRDTIKGAIEVCGGKIVNRRLLNGNFAIVIDNDKKQLNEVKKKAEGVKIVTSEEILIAVLQQQIAFK